MRIRSLVLAILTAGLAAARPGSSSLLPAPPNDEAVSLDLTRGVLEQQHCQTPSGCGHPHVTLDLDSWSSTDTASSLVQHILTLTVTGPFERSSKRRGPHHLELFYELVNPTGQANNVICASAIDKGRSIQRCVRGIARSGRLVLPLPSASPEAIALQFNLMPLSAGNQFVVKHVQIVAGQARHLDDSAENRGPVDLADGRLRQVGCLTPIGCAHPDVLVTSKRFVSMVPKAGSDTPPKPSDNPNQPPSDNPPHLPARLSLELPVKDAGRGPRALQFAYRIDGAAGQDVGRIRITALAGASVLQSTIETVGAGTATFAVPPGQARIDNVIVSFEPSGSSDARFEVSDMTYGVRDPRSPDTLPVTDATMCDTCDPPASRLDPCGPQLATFFVRSADGREGRGIRCVSRDLKAWYGEGWWNDPDWGRYRHLGSVTDTRFGLPSEGAAVNFGNPRRVPVPGGEIRVEYGRDDVQTLRIELLDLSRLRVSSAGGTWNEIWEFVPKGALLPAFFGPMPWDGGCGSFGLVRFEGRGGYHYGQVRCAIPSDFVLRPADDHVALPLVWLGESYLTQTDGDLTRTHLGWQVLPPEAPSPTAFYEAADVCAPDRLDGCTSMDWITMEVLGPEAPADVTSPQYSYWLNDFPFHIGLYVWGSDVTWRTSGGEGGLDWAPSVGLPPGTALPEPTPVCLDCP